MQSCAAQPSAVGRQNDGTSFLPLVQAAKEVTAIVHVICIKRPNRSLVTSKDTCASLTLEESRLRFHERSDDRDPANTQTLPFLAANNTMYFH